jgi:caspase domain-containing protein
MRRPPVHLTIALALAAVLRPVTATPVNGTFVLEVSELKLEVSENTAATLPNSFINRLELRILRSSQEIPPGKIIVRINGEAANIIMSTRTADSAIMCDLDLNFRPGFLLHSGRNSIEVSTESIYGRPSYATFLLDVRDEPASLREIQREVYASKPGERPPSIHLITPQGPVENVREVSLQGYVEGGFAPVTVTVQGEPIRLKAPTRPSEERSVLPETAAISYGFSTPVALASKQDSIELVATDAHNNRVRLRIPVIQGIRTPSQRWAVVIGVSRYRDNRISRLQFADRDAESIRDFLVDPRGGAVRPENMLYLANEEATFARIRSALFDFLTKPGPDDLAIVYFAGHGTNDFKKRPDNYYLLGYDTDLENLGSTAVPMWDLQAAFERTLQANVVTLVDACHSGGIGQAVPNMTNQRWIKAGFGRHRAIITASDVDEVSREGDQWGGHGVFTYYVLQGLKGSADAHHDRKITVGELFDFVRPHVVKATGGAQTPTAQAGLARAVVLTPGGSGTTASNREWVQSTQGGEPR